MPIHHRYTRSIDVYSFGRTLAVMLHCKKRQCFDTHCASGALPHYHLIQIRDRVEIPERYMEGFPPEAVNLIEKCTRQCTNCVQHKECTCPETRGEFAQIKTDRFFQSFRTTLQGENMYFDSIH